jgi:hypothetical protein
MAGAGASFAAGSMRGWDQHNQNTGNRNSKMANNQGSFQASRTAGASSTSKLFNPHSQQLTSPSSNVSPWPGQGTQNNEMMNYHQMNYNQDPSIWNSVFNAFKDFFNMNSSANPEPANNESAQPHGSQYVQGNMYRGSQGP